MLSDAFSQLGATNHGGRSDSGSAAFAFAFNRPRSSLTASDIEGVLDGTAGVGGGE